MSVAFNQVTNRGILDRVSRRNTPGDAAVGDAPTRATASGKKRSPSSSIEREPANGSRIFPHSPCLTNCFSLFFRLFHLFFFQRKCPRGMSCLRRVEPAGNCRPSRTRSCAISRRDSTLRICAAFSRRSSRIAVFAAFIFGIALIFRLIRGHHPSLGVS